MGYLKYKKDSQHQKRVIIYDYQQYKMIENLFIHYEVID